MDSRGRTALAHAAAAGHVATVQLLLSIEPATSALPPEAAMPAHTGAARPAASPSRPDAAHDTQIASALALARRASPLPVLSQSCAVAAHAVVLMAVNACRADDMGRTAVMLAAAAGHTAVIEAILRLARSLPLASLGATQCDFPPRLARLLSGSRVLPHLSR